MQKRKKIPALLLTLLLMLVLAPAAYADTDANKFVKKFSRPRNERRFLLSI